MPKKEDGYLFQDIPDYLAFMATYKTKSRNTIKRTRNSLRLLSRWLVASYGIKAFGEVTSEMLSAHMADYLSKNMSSSAVPHRCAVQGFLDWMAKEGRMVSGGKVELPPMRSVEAGTPGILTPDSIFEMRQAVGARMRSAMLIELLLSSGMRGDEANQVRPCDLRFGDSPIDITTGKPSIYVGGSIALKTELFTIKNNKSRITYFSVLAKRMILQYMDRMGLRPESRSPLCPFGIQTIADDFAKLKEQIPSLRTKVFENRKRGERESIDDYDLDGSESEEYLRSLEGKAARNNHFVGPVDPFSGLDIIERERGLHRHKLRHSFTCFQYYRAYTGERHDSVRVSAMLGHGSLASTHHYLTQIEAIKSMDEWKRLWLGATGDWSRLE